MTGCLLEAGGCARDASLGYAPWLASDWKLPATHHRWLQSLPLMRCGRFDNSSIFAESNLLDEVQERS